MDKGTKVCNRCFRVTQTVRISVLGDYCIPCYARLINPRGCDPARDPLNAIPLFQGVINEKDSIKSM